MPLLVFLALFFIACGDKIETGPAAPDEAAESPFADPALDAAVRQALGVPGAPLTQADLLSLDSLSASQ